MERLDVASVVEGTCRVQTVEGIIVEAQDIEGSDERAALENPEVVAECADEERTKGTVSEVGSSLETDISLRETSEVIIVLLSFGTLFRMSESASLW